MKAGILALRALRIRNRPLTLNELVEETGMSKSSLSRFMKVLTHVRIIEHEPNKKGFSIGEKALDYMIAWGLDWK